MYRKRKLSIMCLVKSSFILENKIWKLSIVWTHLQLLLLNFFSVFFLAFMNFKTFHTPLICNFRFLYLGETFSPLQLVGAIVTLVAIYMVNYRNAMEWSMYVIMMSWFNRQTKWKCHVQARLLTLMTQCGDVCNTYAYKLGYRLKLCTL